MSSPRQPKGSKRERFAKTLLHGFGRVQDAVLPLSRPAPQASKDVPSPSVTSSAHPSASQPITSQSLGTHGQPAGALTLTPGPIPAPVNIKSPECAIDKLQEVGSAAWTGLETALRVLEGSADVFPPLKSAICGLVDCLDIIQAASTNREDYDEMTAELTTMAASLGRYMSKIGSDDPGDSAARIALLIGAEVAHIDKQQARGKGRRMLDSTKDKEDVIKRYRRIEALFRQLQSDISLRAWEATDKQFKMLLLERLSPLGDALYNSSYSVTIKRRGCTPETRQKLQADLQDWVKDPDAAKVYWMNGMAGTGKTTIAYSLCEWLEENKLLGASFFCSRASSSCCDANQIIPTIAFQLARYSPAFRFALCKTLEEDPNTSKLNIVWQFKKLVQEPMRELKSSMPGGVVVIDALDECEDAYGLRLILETLLKLAVDLPLKFFLTSRPEPTIREKMLFLGGDLPSALHLHDIEQSIVEEDIKKYLMEALKPMSPPPSPEETEQLAKRAGKLFIYAATAARYILPDDIRVNSNLRLKHVLATTQAAQQAGFHKQYKELDALYLGILNIAFDPERLEEEEIHVLQLVLWTVVCAKEPMTMQTLAPLLGVPEQEVSLALQPLQSVLHVSEASGLISTLHVSFSDFILDRLRSGKFYCDETQHSELLAHRCFSVMKEQLRFNICNLESSCMFDKDVPDLEQRVETCISPTLLYACRYWGSHLRLGNGSGDICTKLVEFLARRLLFWMEVMNLSQCAVMGADVLLQAQCWLSTHYNQPEAQKQVADAQEFVTRFAAGPCTRSTPHIYISLLPFCRRSSSVYDNYWGYTRGLMNVKGTAIRQRDKAALATWMLDSMIRAARFSPDGTCIVSGSDDGTVRVWNARTGDAVTGPFKGHTDVVWSVAFSPSGKCIVSGSVDCTIRVWDARTGEPLAGPFTGHTEAVWSVAFASDGTRIVSGSRDHTVQVWDASTGGVIVGPLKGHTGWVTSVAFSPDGTRIVSSSSDRTIRVWDACTGAPAAAPFQGHTNTIWSVMFSPDGTRIVSGSRDHTVRVWSADMGKLLSKPFEGHSDIVYSVAFSPDGTRIVSGSRDHTIRVWDAYTGGTLAEPLEGHTGSVTSVAFSPGGTHIVSGSHDCTIRMWDAYTVHEAARMSRGHTNAVISVAFSPDNTRIASGSADCTIRVWDVRTGDAVVGPLEGHTSMVWSVAFSPNGTCLASGSADCTIRVWDPCTGGTVAAPFEGHRDTTITSVAFSPDSTRIVSGSNDCTIQVWDAHTGSVAIGSFQGHKDMILSVGFSPNGIYIVSGSADCTVRVWDARTGNAVAGPFQGHTDVVCSVAFSPDSSRIVSGSNDHTICVWDACTGDVVAGPFREHADTVWSVAFSPDGTLIASGSADRTIRVRDARTGHTVARPFQGHTSLVYSVAFSSDGTRIASGSCDHTIRVWDTPTLDVSVGSFGGQMDSLLSITSLPPSSHNISNLDNDTDDVPHVQTTHGLHLLTEAHIRNAFGGVKDFSWNNDGWVTTNDIPLLWISPDFRRHLPYPRNPLVIGPQGSAYIDYQNLLLGERWSECYVPQ